MYTERRKLFFVYASAGLLLCLYVAITIMQLVYSPERAVYGAKIGGESVQGKSKDEIANVAQRLYNETTFKVMAEDSELVSVPAPQLDTTFDSQAAADLVMHYSIAERLIPFTLWLKRPSLATVSIETNSEVVQAALAEKLGDSGQVDPVNATLIVDEAGAVKISPEKKGAKVDREELGKLFISTEAPLGGVVSYSSTTEMIPAAIVTSDLTDAQKRAQRVIDRSILLTLGDQRVALNSKDVAVWLTFGYADGDVQIGLDTAKVSAALETEFGPKVNIAAGKSTATLYDSVEISRTEGTPGKAVDSAAIIAKMTQTFTKEGSSTPEVAVTSRVVAPTVAYTYTYSKTLAGLQAYVRQLGADSDTRVSVRQLSGSGWSAAVRDSEQTVSASTYKLFVALYLLREIAAGTVSYNDEVLGTTVRACMEKMIVNYDNACAEAFLEKYGATKINGVLWSLGYSRQTSLTSSDGLAKTTTADLNKALQDIEQGSVIAGEGRSFLLELMGRQVYRQGVPAGTAAAVKDKVGFIQDYLNDAAIVSHPKGTYVISIMTKGQSWAKIAEITRQVESIMYP